jgi:hypothetical protein
MVRGARSLMSLVAWSVISCSSQLPPSPSPPSAGGTWPNEPAGMRVLTDWGFDQAPPTAGDVPIPNSPGWSVVYGTPPGPDQGTVELTSDPSAPLSPPSVYDVIYPKGMVEGTAPTTIYYPRSGGRFMRLLSGNDGLNTNEVYVGFWWKPSAPFDYGPNGNKIAFLFNGGGEAGGQQFIILMPDGRLHVLPEYPGDYRWRRPNADATIVSLGAWHRIEWYCNLSTGTLKWWLDERLQGSHTDVRNPYQFDVFKLSPTWGGNTGARKRETDHYWFDHLRLSVR